jgi:2-oxoisovalerate dehydrogenase E2 component (dihydrolipoyl transacylase)
LWTFPGFVKATVEISSRYDGVVKKVHFSVGEMVQVGSALVDIEVDVEGEESEEASASDSPSPNNAPPASGIRDQSASTSSVTPSKEVGY